MLDGEVPIGYFTSNPPAGQSGLAGPAKLPAPSFTCRGGSSATADPAGDEMWGRSVSAPWVDIRRVELIGSPSAPCLRVTLAAPLRDDTYLRFDGYVFFLDGYGSPTFSGLAGTSLTPGTHYGEVGDTLTLRLDPAETWSLKSLQLCAVSTQFDEPYLAQPVAAVDSVVVDRGDCTTG
jgi:hypothetical protein